MNRVLTVLSAALTLALPLAGTGAYAQNYNDQNNQNDNDHRHDNDRRNRRDTIKAPGIPASTMATSGAIAGIMGARQQP